MSGFVLELAIQVSENQVEKQKPHNIETMIDPIDLLIEQSWISSCA